MNYITRILFHNHNLIQKMSSNFYSLSQLERSFMYAPGDKQKMIDKIISFPHTQAPDIIVLDCEDSVSYDNKALARKNIFNVIETGAVKKCSHSTLCIRTNTVTSPLLAMDDVQLICNSLKASNYHYPQMVNIPKVESFDDIMWLDEQIKSNIDVGKLSGPLLLSIMIESCRAVVNLKKLLKKSVKHQMCLKLSNIVFGSDDYCATLGAVRTQSNDEVLYARQHVANLAASFNVSAIDMVDIDLNDMDGLERNCKFGATIGFVGKQVIHPKQLEIVHKSFSPALNKVDWAQELIKEYEKQKADKCGAFVFRNQMIDMPTIIQAQRITNMVHLIKNK